MYDEDDIDDLALEPKRKPTVDDLDRFIDQAGKLTAEGKYCVRRFSHEFVEEDEDGALSIEDLEDAFKKCPYGFAIDQTTESVSTIICNDRVSVYIPGTDPKLRESFVASKIQENEDGSLRARLIDDLGFERFDPAKGDSTAVEYIVDQLLPLEGVHMFVSLPERFKSWVAYQIAIDVSRGRPALGHYTTKKGRAVIVDFELGRREVMRRLAMLGGDGHVMHKSFPKHDVNSEAFWTELAKLQARFVVVDGLGAGQTGIGEMDSRFAEPLTRAMKFAEQNQCTFLFLHHSTKACTLADVESMFSGTGAIRRKVDSAFYFHRLSDGRAEVVPVKTRKGTAPESFKIQLTDGRGVELCNEDDEPAAPEGTEDRILRAIEERGNEGISMSALSVDLEIPKKRVLETCGRLRDTERIAAVGGGRSARLVAVKSVPDSVPDSVLTPFAAPNSGTE